LALLGGLLWLDRADPPRRDMPVRLVTGGPSPERAAPLPLAPRRAWAPARPALPVPAPGPLSSVPEASPDEGPTGAEWEPFEGPAADWWAGRSLVPWVQDCRAGASTPDSVLDRERTLRELGRERTTASLNQEFRARRWDWMLEEFREAYARNFPLMR